MMRIAMPTWPSSRNANCITCNTDWCNGDDDEGINFKIIKIVFDFSHFKGNPSGGGVGEGDSDGVEVDIWKFINFFNF